MRHMKIGGDGIPELRKHDISEESLNNVLEERYRASLITLPSSMEARTCVIELLSEIGTALTTTNSPSGIIAGSKAICVRLNGEQADGVDYLRSGAFNALCTTMVSIIVSSGPINTFFGHLRHTRVLGLFMQTS